MDGGSRGWSEWPRRREGKDVQVNGVDNGLSEVNPDVEDYMGMMGICYLLTYLLIVLFKENRKTNNWSCGSNSGVWELLPYLI